MKKPPSGTITFLFTDVQDSTRLWDKAPAGMGQVLERHDEIIDNISEKHNGYLVRPRGEGDSRFVVFERAIDGVLAAAEIQQLLYQEDWPGEIDLLVRISLHTGEGEFREGDYYGPAVNRCARLRSIIHGGQVVLSQTTYDLVQDSLQGEIELRDLGMHLLEGMTRKEHIYQLLHPNLPDHFPPIDSIKDVVLPDLQIPGFLNSSLPEPRKPVFVARETQLNSLNTNLDSAIDNHGGMVFLIGSAGGGKTALLNEFSRQAMETHPDLLVGVGVCNSFTGISDPYLPFREIMGMLTGDVEARWTAGLLSTDHAQRIWDTLPDTLMTLIQYAPHLVERILRGADLLSRAQWRAEDDPGWYYQLVDLVNQQRYYSKEIEQSSLYEEYINMLGELSKKKPLLLILDDMQWMDESSIGLLFYLGRHLQDKRILIIGSYRPEEIIPDHSDRRHPLGKIINELKLLYGDIFVDLNLPDEQEDQRFVREFLDTEPNHLGVDFQTSLYHHTDGHPLFTIELLRAMMERGDLKKDAQGYWIEGTKLDWDTLPTQVEAVIEERVSHLDKDLIEILKIASVEGEEFTTLIMGRILNIDERKLLSSLSNELEDRHMLVRQSGTAKVGRHFLSRYRFTHTMIQHFLYTNLVKRERQIIHGEIGKILEDVYQEQNQEIVIQLARHFQEADMPDKAKEYLLRAGHHARNRYAHEDAIKFYQRALTILEAAGDQQLIAETKQAMGLVHLVAGNFEEAGKIFNIESAHWELIGYSREKDRRVSPETMRLAVEQPTTLDPGMAVDDVSTFLIAQLFDGLLTLGKDHNILPGIADRWQVDDHGKRYTFYLNEEIYWSDGTRLTAHDFVFGWLRNLHPDTQSPAAHLLYPIRNAREFGEGMIKDPAAVGVKALNELTLEVTLATPAAYFPNLMTLSVSYPLPKWVVEKSPSSWTDPQNLVTNGPYQLTTWQPKEYMLLQKNPYYSMGYFPGNAETINCSLIADYEDTLDQYSRDQFDVVTMFNADPGTVVQARRMFGDELVSISQPSTFYVSFLVDRPPFDDVVIRRAFAHSIDRVTLVRETQFGQRLPATGGFVPPSIPGHSPDIGLKFDPQHARSLLAQAGFPDGIGFPQIDWIHGRGSTNERVVPFIQKSWEEHLNIKLAPQGLDWMEFKDRLDDNPANITLIGWSADYRDPDNFLRVVFHCKEGINNPHWRNDPYDSVVEEALRTNNQEKRKRLYAQADRMLVAEEAVIIPLSYGEGQMLVKPYVKLPDSRPVTIPLKDFVIRR